MMRIELQGGSLRKHVSKILLLSIVAVGFINCGKPTNNSCGFTLQEFEVIHLQLKSLIVVVLDSTQFKDRWYDERGNPESIPVIELIENDSTLEFGFVSASKGSLSLKYIFEENKRIVGYLHIEKDTFIVLSNVDSQFKFYNTFYYWCVNNLDILTK